MRNHTLNKVLLATLLLATTAAHAQYAWIDDKGVRQYSDKPPPPDTPDAKILKMPRGSMPSTPATTDASKLPPSLAEREADYVKRHAEADKAAAKAATDKGALDAKHTQCQAAAAAKAQLDSGRRLRNEEHNVMTEEDKAKAIARADAVLKDCRQASN